jgi:hypothetical protein
MRLMTRILSWTVLALFVGIVPTQAQQSIEAFYDARFPPACNGQEISPSLRQQLKSKLRSEFKKTNPMIEAIGVLEIKCAFDDKKKVLGAIVLGYGIVADPDGAYEHFRNSGEIGGWATAELFGVFQYNSSLTTLGKTLTVFRSRRWRDYLVDIELTSPTRLLLRGMGSYGDVPIREEFTIAW